MSVLDSIGGSAEDLLPVDGARLLDDLHAVSGRYVAWPSEEAHDAVVCWIAATHAQTAWDHAPRLVLTSPEKRCGKSRALDVVEGTCHAPLISVNISPAALVRSITGDDPPTLLVDEADTIFGTKRSAENNEDLRGILNAGFEHNRPYIRWDMKARQIEECPTFTMAALASIGDLPDTVMDRAVVVRMRRRAAGETVSPYRARRDGPELQDIRERLSIWAQNNLKRFTEYRPVMPVEDRAADTWEPLVAVADTAGGTWPERIRAACLFLVAANDADGAESSLGVKLLADILDVFASKHTEFIASRDLVDGLQAIGEAPWADFNLSMNSLARRLQHYGIRPRPNQTRTLRGYYEQDFTDAWSRYLPSTTVQVSRQGSDQEKYPGQLPFSQPSPQVSSEMSGRLPGQLQNSQPSTRFPRSEGVLDGSDALDSCIARGCGND